METARCKAFLASVELGSFTRAAEALNYTASGVSQLVSALEQELGFPLLRRNKKGVLATAEGEELLPAVRDFLRQEERIYQMAAQVKGLAVGSITIASYSSIAAHWLPGLIRVFQEAYPSIRIKLMEGIRQEVCKWLDTRVADIGFLSYKSPMPYDWLPIAEDRMLAVLPKDHPLAQSKAYPLKACQNEPFIMPALGWDDDVMGLFQEEAIEPSVRFSTLENFAAMAMIQQGLGMSIMNELITRSWQCDVAKLPLDPPKAITLGIALPSLAKASPAAKRFIRFAVERLTRPEAGQRTG